MFNYVYDPQRQDYDSNLWKSITGTPAMSGTKIRFTSATAVHLGDNMKGNFKFCIDNTVDPVAGQDKIFGLISLAKGVYAYFKIAEDVFTSETIDEKGNTKSTVIAWDVAYSGANTVYTIQWTGQEVKFKIGTSCVAIHETSFPMSTPMSFYVKNGNADNLDVVYIEAQDVETYL